MFSRCVLPIHCSLHILHRGIDAIQIIFTPLPSAIKHLALYFNGRSNLWVNYARNLTKTLTRCVCVCGCTHTHTHFQKTRIGSFSKKKRHHNLPGFDVCGKYWAMSVPNHYQKFCSVILTDLLCCRHWPRSFSTMVVINCHTHMVRTVSVSVAEEVWNGYCCWSGFILPDPCWLCIWSSNMTSGKWRMPVVFFNTHPPPHPTHTHTHTCARLFHVSLFALLCWQRNCRYPSTVFVVW